MKFSDENEEYLNNLLDKSYDELQKKQRQK